MKAVRLHELRNRAALRIDEVPDPTPGPGEIVVDLAVASVNFPDILMLDGKYQIRPELPFIVGKDGSGTVSAIGHGVDDFKPGDRALFYIHYGAFAQKVLMPASACSRLPKEMSFDIAAAMGVTFQTAWAALVDRARCKPGDRVLVTGAAGGVGMACIALAKALGAGLIIGGLTTPSKAPAVIAAGADHVLNMSGGNIRDTLSADVKSVTSGTGVDIVIDVAGGDVFDACLRSLNFSGRIVVLGFTAGRIPEVKTNYLLLKNITVHGSSINAFYAQDLPAVRRGQAEMFRLHADGKLTPHIHSRFPLTEVAQAIAEIENRSVIGKVLLEV